MYNISFAAEKAWDNIFDREETISHNETCDCCNGSGKVYLSCCNDVMEPNQTQCPTCKEECGYLPEMCDECKGEGVCYE